MPRSVQDLPVIAFASASEWKAWLADRHETSPGLWMKIAKKSSGIPSITYAEALDIALCHGWIDGQRRSHDDTHFLQRFTRRTPRSVWSQVNRARAIELIDQGLMQPAGRRAVEAAQADGRWAAAYGGQRTAEVPDDLREALAANPVAAELFATLTGRNRFAILYRIQDAKRPETRARRIQAFVEMLAKGETPYPTRSRQ